jgi:hypothetical protein
MQESKRMLTDADNVEDAERRLATAQQNYNNASVFNKPKFVCISSLSAYIS